MQLFFLDASLFIHVFDVFWKSFEKNSNKDKKHRFNEIDEHWYPFERSERSFIGFADYFSWNTFMKYLFSFLPKIVTLPLNVNIRINNDSFIRFNLFGFNCYGCREKGGNEVAEGELYFCTETLVSFNYFYFSPSKSWQNVKKFFALLVHASFHHLVIFLLQFFLAWVKHIVRVVEIFIAYSKFLSLRRKI